MGLANLIAIPNIAARLKVPEKMAEKILGPKPDAWCKFHRSFRPLYQFVFGSGAPARRAGQMWFPEGLLAREASGLSIRVSTGEQRRATARGAYSRRDPHHSRRILRRGVHSAATKEVL